MKLANANAIRAAYVEKLAAFLVSSDEDCGMIATNSFNFPVVADDGEEGWVEVSIKIPKGTKDEEYDGYSRREQYEILCAERADKKAKKEAEKAKKIAKKKKEKAE